MVSWKVGAGGSRWSEDRGTEPGSNGHMKWRPQAHPCAISHHKSFILNNLYLDSHLCSPHPYTQMNFRYIKITIKNTIMKKQTKTSKNESRTVFKKMSNKVIKVIQLQKSFSVSNHYGKKRQKRERREKNVLKREKNQCLKEKKNQCYIRVCKNCT